MEYKDYYATLGVTKTATTEEIKRAYRQLARKYHPDVNKEAAAEEMFKEVGEAYEVLKDEDKRKAYDQFGANWQQGQDFRPPPGWEFKDFTGNHRQSRRSAEGFSDFFEALFGGGDSGKTTHNYSYFDDELLVKGRDIRAKLVVSLEESYHGTKKAISLARHDISGGGGATTSLEVAIPKGILEGQQIRLEGQGDIAFEHGRRGDLFLEIIFKTHAIFTVKQRDVFLELPVTPWEAALGATLKIPTLGGPVEFKLPAGTQTGKKLRLKGKGLSSKNQIGDQYIVISIHIPKPETTAQKEIYEKMAKELPFNPRTHLGV